MRKFKSLKVEKLKSTILSTFQPFNLSTLLLIAICAMSAGCIYKGAKVVEGTDLAVGFTVPQADGVAQLDVLNYLSGFRLGVAENAALTVRYTVSETNSYFGCVTTRTMKAIDATVEPCETSTQAPPSPARATEDAHPTRADRDVSHDPTKEPAGTAGNSSPTSPTPTQISN